MSAPYIRSQPALKTFFSCMKSCSLPTDPTDLGSAHLVCGASSERDERKEVERRVSEAQCRLAATDLRLGNRCDVLSLDIVCTKSCNSFALLGTRSTVTLQRLNNY
jgi:hypothetical protein